MTKGIDCAEQLSYDTALALANTQIDSEYVTFVCRYLVPDRYSKYLSKGEADAIKAATLKIVSVYESYADRALEGYDAGYADGLTAAQCAVNAGQPAGSTIYFAVDFDVTDDQMQTVLEYIKGCSEATPDYMTGVYGSHDVVTACNESNVCSHFWQTYAWSRGQKFEYNNLYQYRNGENLCGVNLDLNEAYDNVGWWGQEESAPAAPTETPKQEDPQPEEAPKTEYPISEADANKIIDLLGAAYKTAGFDDTENKGQTEIHRLANLVRKCAGIKEEN